MIPPSLDVLPTRLSLYSFFMLLPLLLLLFTGIITLLLTSVYLQAASQKKFASLHLVQFILFVFGDIGDILSSSCSVPVSKGDSFSSNPLLCSKVSPHISNRRWLLWVLAKLLAPPKVLCIGIPTRAVFHDFFPVLSGPELLVAPGVFLLLESSHVSGRQGHSFYLQSLLWLFIDLRDTVHKPSKSEKLESGSIWGTHWCLMAHPQYHAGRRKRVNTMSGHSAWQDAVLCWLHLPSH